jgi:Tol biopolymer transport system component
VRFLVIVALALAAAPAALATSPGRNGRIAFSAVPKHHRYTSEAIFTATARRRAAKQLTGRRGTRRTGAEQPVFSPDGTHIAFVADSYHWIMRADGSHARKLVKTAPRNGLLLQGPAVWSPRGRTLALTGFSSDPDDPESNVTDTAIYFVNSDGSHLRRVRAGANPVWSPDGRTIAFNGAARCSGIKLMKPSGESVRTLVRGRCGTAGTPIADDLSPSGEMLIFHRIDAFRTSTAPTSDLFTVSVSTRKVNQLTNTPHYSEEDARWSPDGSRLAFARRARTSNRPKVFGTFIATPAARILSRFNQYPLRVSWQPGR